MRSSDRLDLGYLILMNEATTLLRLAANGDPSAAEQLLPLIYNELRQLAVRRLANERPDHTLQATALVHEAYLRLVGSADEEVWDGRSHFFAAAAESMRRILVEAARRKQSQKRGGDWEKLDIDRIDVSSNDRAERLIAIDEALARFETVDPKKAELVKLRFYVGLSIPEAAETLDMSIATANRHWKYAKAWLQHEMEKD